jgi:hypothetical protein
MVQRSGKLTNHCLCAINEENWILVKAHNSALSTALPTADYKTGNWKEKIMILKNRSAKDRATPEIASFTVTMRE